MNLHHRINVAIAITILFLFLSMFTQIIPCQKAPNLPNSNYKWDFCTLNPDVTATGMSIHYFGYTQLKTEAYLILIALVFITTLIILHFIFRHHILH